MRRLFHAFALATIVLAASALSASAQTTSSKGLYIPPGTAHFSKTFAIDPTACARLLAYRSDLTQQSCTGSLSVTTIRLTGAAAAQRLAATGAVATGTAQSSTCCGTVEIVSEICMEANLICAWVDGLWGFPSSFSYSWLYWVDCSRYYFAYPFQNSSKGWCGSVYNYTGHSQSGENLNISSPWASWGAGIRTTVYEPNFHYSIGCWGTDISGYCGLG